MRLQRCVHEFAGPNIRLYNFKTDAMGHVVRYRQVVDSISTSDRLEVMLGAEDDWRAATGTVLGFPLGWRPSDDKH